MSSSKPLLSVQDLRVDFASSEGPVAAVKGISFDIPYGKTMGLVGESGSGKSVSSLAVMRLLPQPPARISSGKILFEGQDLLALSEAQMRKMRGNRLSMIFQEPMTSLNPVFTTGFQVAEVLKIHKGLSNKEAWEKTVDLFAQVGIPHPRERVKSYPHEMSGGQKQRVMIAMAMACQPQLLIADEPTTALDVTIQKQVLELMRGLKEKHAMSMLFITHDLGVIAEVADYVSVMYKGQIVEQGSVEEIFRQPQHPYTKGLLACRPSLKSHPRRLPTVSDFMSEDGRARETSRVDATEKVVRHAPTGEAPLLQVNNLEKHFNLRGGFFSGPAKQVKAVDGVSFNIHRGRTLGVVGESGCGKTTLGRALLRLVEPTGGDVSYNGKPLLGLGREEMRQMRRKMQIIFQDPYASLNPRMSVGATLMEPMGVHNLGGSKKEREDRAKSLLTRVGLEAKHFTRYPHEFSGGQRQRICIARALAVEPEFIVCDESVSALDVSVQAQVLNLLLDLQDEFKLTYMFISHDLSVVKFISDEVMVMYGGKVVEQADALSIYERPQHDYTKKLLSAIPAGR